MHNVPHSIGLLSRRQIRIESRDRNTAGHYRAIAAEELEINRHYLESNGVSVASAMSLADSELHVMTVPTLIAVDGNGARAE